MTFDFPHPFGPTIQVISPGKDTEVGSTKDLKPESFIPLSFIFHFCLRVGNQRPVAERQ